MGFSILRFERAAQIQWGLLREEKVFPFASDSSLADLLRAKAWLKNLSTDAISRDEIRILSPITTPCQIICQGKNYRDHMLEMGVKSKDHNILFTKADSSVTSAMGSVVRPEGVHLLDYEIELALVMGAELPANTEVKSLEPYVAALVIANDISARDVQIPQRQWFKGKSFRTFCPLGPILYVLEPQDYSQVKNLDLHLQVNGETRQKSNTKMLMHGPEETLSEISQIFSMRVGDVLLTGTPGGVAMKIKAPTFFQELVSLKKSDKEKFAHFVEEQRKSPRYLKDGDEIRASIRSADGKIDLGEQVLRVSSR